MPEISIRISADTSSATPKVTELKASFEGLAEEIAKAMKKADAESQKASSTILDKLGAALKGIAGIAGAALGGLGSLASGAFGAIVSAAEGAVKLVGVAFDGLSAALGLVFNKVTAIVAAATGFVVTKIAEQASSSESFRVELDLLAKQAGTTGEAITKAIVTGSGRTISSFDAMRVANQALIQGVIRTPEQFEKLAGIADKLNDTLGVDTAEAFLQLVHGIENGNEKLLKGVGIFADAKKATDEYAAAIGKKTDDLTQAEKAQAFLNAVLEQGAEITRRTATSTDLLGDKFARLKVGISEAYDVLAGAFGPALGVIADALDPIVQRVEQWIAANAGLVQSELSSWAATLADVLGRVAGRLPEIADTVGGALSTAFGVAKTAADFLWRGITDGIAGVQREFGIFSDAVQGFLQGRGFDASGSALLAVFNVVAAGVKVLAFKAAEAFSESFSGAAVALANVMRELKNDVLSVQQGIAATKALATQLNPLASENDILAARSEARSTSASLESQKRRSPVTLDEVQSGLATGRAAAQGDLDAALAKLGAIGTAIDQQGGDLRDRASDSIDRFGDSVKTFFATDAERQERLREAADDNHAASARAFDSVVGILDEQTRREIESTAKYKEIAAKIEQLRRLQNYNSGAFDGPAIVTGN